MKPSLTLTDKQWEVIEPILPGRPGDPGRSGDNNRMALEGMIWICRTGSPWRGLPEEFGKWNSVHRRFRRWTIAGAFDRIFDILDELDLQTIMADGSLRNGGTRLNVNAP